MGRNGPIVQIKTWAQGIFGTIDFLEITIFFLADRYIPTRENAFVLYLVLFYSELIVDIFSSSCISPSS